MYACVGIRACVSVCLCVCVCVCVFKQLLSWNLVVAVVVVCACV